MDNEKRLIDVDAFRDYWNKNYRHQYANDTFLFALANFPTVDAVEVEKYKALVEMYHDLRDNFIDYYCSGAQNVAPYCLNRCEECVDKWGYCKQYSDYCKGFNPAEVILDDAKMDGDGNED